ncbi:MAG: beta-glucosidase BglX [Ilumatobacteraceae bacterium]
MTMTDAQIDELIARMTVEEKAGQLTQYFSFTVPAEEDLPADMDRAILELPKMVGSAVESGGAGSLLFVADPNEVNRLQRLAVEGSRLGIPLLFGFDVVHGFRTVLPVPIGMAASWDPDIVEAAQSVAAREARAVGIHWTFAPMVDIARDPRWGRIVEGAGEDPFLGAAMAVAQVRGFQGDDLGGPGSVIAGPKHFAGYGAGLGGRDYDEVNLSDSELWNVYFPPFAAAVEAGAGNIMTAYMELNGIPGSGNRWLFTEVLRETWGFDGFVVSDANAVRSLVTQDFASDLTDAATRAIGAGVDMEMAVFAPAFARLPAAIESGRLSERELDESVRRVLRAKARMGLFDDPYVDPSLAASVLDDPSHRDVARLAAERAAVLLKNDSELLPLDSGSIGSIAVIGPLADSKRDALGPWVFDAIDVAETVSVLDGIRRKVGDAVRVEHARGVSVARRRHSSPFAGLLGSAKDPVGFDETTEFDRAIAIARDADIAVVVVGEWQDQIGEVASRSTLDLPGRQQELLEAVVATGTPVVLLVMNGRPLELSWAAEHVPAILDIWYPGTQGGTAIADLLFGDASPGGKLPFTWPRSVGQVPLIYSHTVSQAPEGRAHRYWDADSTPLFPFGHGLSYGRFEYSNLAVDRASVPLDGTVVVSVDVTNTGARSGDEVVQLYVHQRHGTAARPARELKGFQRVEVRSGQTRTVEFTIGPAERRYWNAATRGWVLDAATFDVWVGGDSTASTATSFLVDPA